MIRKLLLKLLLPSFDVELGANVTHEDLIQLENQVKMAMYGDEPYIMMETRSLAELCSAAMYKVKHDRAMNVLVHDKEL
jgi:hypothetical protein